MDILWMPILKGSHYYLLLFNVSATLKGSIWIFLVSCNWYLSIVCVWYSCTWEALLHHFCHKIYSVAAIIHSRMLLSICADIPIPMDWLDKYFIQKHSKNKLLSSTVDIRIYWSTTLRPILLHSRKPYAYQSSSTH